LTDFQRMLKSNFMKTCPLEAGLFHVDGQTDMMNSLFTLL